MKLTKQQQQQKRFRQFRQSDERAGSHSGHERVPDRYEAAQSPAQTAKRRQSTLLKQLNNK